MREFIFKFYNNKLGLNTRTSHFGGDTRDCTFCSLLGDSGIDESFVHLFFEFRIVDHFHSSIDSTLFNFLNESTIDRKRRWFGCINMERENMFLRLFFLTVQFFIWGAKLSKFIPTADFLVGETVILLDNACQLSLELEQCRTSLNNVLSRHWNTLRARRW